MKIRPHQVPAGVGADEFGLALSQTLKFAA